MSNKPGIPAWQRAQQPLQSTTPPPTTQPTEDTDTKDNDTTIPEQSSAQQDIQETTTEDPSTQEVTLSAEERSQQLDIVKSFLEDPGVKDEPVEKKREFLESKGIAQAVIDQELGTKSTSSPQPSINTAEFASFKEASQPPRAQPQPPARIVAPPIITYPEFLEDARKPPPLITPMRVLNATYIASAVAAIAYGASTFLVKPMAASLTDARHEFATHGQSKIDELNERLSKIVSKIPEPKSATDAADFDDVESVASDPTELFHRDIGTQTSPPVTPAPSSGAQSEIKTTAEKQNDRLSIIKSHLDEMLSGLEAGEQPAKDRLEETNKLRHHLDNMMYRVQTQNVWSTGFGADQKPGSDADDAIEEVKKEIRGVKGVLLSAKRFAPVGTVSGRAGS
ncbi:hypothetical protein Q7P36_009363 [Cladosporium allicinum]